jgi:hypothetical protein
MKDNQKIIVVLFVAILIVGVISVFVFSGNTNEITTDADEMAAEVNTNEDIVTEEPKTGSVPTLEQVQETAEDVAEESLVPTPRAGLESTDPSVVNLASGEIQLVEFFAYW